MAALLSVFLSTVLLAFGLTLIVAGLSGAYFGKGRSRAIGFLLTLVAVLLVGLFSALTWPIVPGVVPTFDPQIVAQSMVAVVAAMLGAVLAVGAFVMAIMRS